jgi:hypothetical protein
MAKLVSKRAAWLAARKAAGLPLTMGRKRGGRNRPQAEIEAEKAERILRRINRLARMERKRRARSESTGQSWPDAERRSDEPDFGPAPAGRPESDAPIFDRPVVPESTFDTSSAPPLDTLNLIEQAFAAADAAGLHLQKADIIALEHAFIARAEAGGLPGEVMERIFHLLMRQESRLDRGDLADLRRRARLETAYAQWKTTLAGPDVRARNLPKSRPRLAETPPAGAYSASPLACPPATQPVDNYGDNPAVEDAKRRRSREAVEAAKVAGQHRGPLSAAPWLRGR